MNLKDIMAATAPYPARLVVLTGGEPSLYANDNLVNSLHAAGKYVAVETNGTHVLPKAADWITLSPKNDIFPNTPLALSAADEIKVVFQNQENIEKFLDFPAKHYFLQPCDTGDEQKNLLLREECVRYCKEHPQWRLSLQLHKILRIS